MTNETLKTDDSNNVGQICRNDSDNVGKACRKCRRHRAQTDAISFPEVAVPYPNSILRQREPS